MATGSGDKYKWYVFAIAMLVNISFGFSWLGMPALFTELAEDLNLSPAQLGAIWGMMQLAGLFFAFLSGLLVDRLGFRLATIIGCLIGAAAGAARGMSVSFAMLATAMFFFGMCHPLLMPSVTKSIRTWFGTKQLGLALGTILASVTGTGAVAVMISGTVLSPALGGWRSVMFLYAGILFLVGIVWYLTVREPRPTMLSGLGSGEPESTKVPFKEAFLKVIRLKDVWLCSIAVGGVAACNQPAAAFMPWYLEQIGLPLVIAHTTSSAAGWGITFGVIVWPVVSDRVGLRKPIYIMCALLEAIVVLNIPTFSHIAPLPFLLAFGIFGGGALVHHNIIVTEMKEVGPRYAGTAIGIMGLVTGITTFVSPIIGGAIAETSPDNAFRFWAVLPVISVVCMSLVKETGHRTRKASGE